jgi:hypothetical protein
MQAPTGEAIRSRIMRQCVPPVAGATACQRCKPRTDPINDVPAPANLRPISAPVSPPNVYGCGRLPAAGQGTDHNRPEPCPPGGQFWPSAGPQNPFNGPKKCVATCNGALHRGAKSPRWSAERRAPFAKGARTQRCGRTGCAFRRSIPSPVARGKEKGAPRASIKRGGGALATPAICK